MNTTEQPTAQQFTRTFTGPDDYKEIWTYDLTRTTRGPVSVEIIFPEAEEAPKFIDLKKTLCEKWGDDVDARCRKMMYGGSCVQFAVSMITGIDPVALVEMTNDRGYSISRRHTLKTWREDYGISQRSGTNVNPERLAEITDQKGEWIRRPDLIGETINQIQKRFPNDTFYISVKRHALALIKGTLHDWAYKKGRRCVNVIQYKD